MSEITLFQPEGVLAATHPELASALRALPELDLHELRVRWRKLYRRPAPAHLRRALLIRIMAYRMQADVLGHLDRDAARFLDRVAAALKAGKGKDAVPPVPRVRRLKPGTLLVREHDGVLQRVTVMADGYAWNGQTYSSLSEVARAITGTNWNGPRFFGLRDRTVPIHTMELAS